MAAMREAAGLTQDEAAERLGLASGNTVSRWETGARHPNAADYLRATELYRRLADERRSETVPRGTEKYQAIADRFRREMLRLGATDFDDDHVKERLQHLEASRFFREGEDGVELTPAQQMEEYVNYIEYSLRPWVVQRIEKRRRHAKPTTETEGGDQ